MLQSTSPSQADGRVGRGEGQVRAPEHQIGEFAERDPGQAELEPTYPDAKEALDAEADAV
jgi:hypothetical protein